MAFLDRFTPEHRAHFESVAQPIQLDKGQYLLRRGEPVGDIYVLIRGELEVVDTRATPEVILALLPEGAVVGEMAFVDDSPRSADVRAGDASEVLQWPRDDLRRLLARHPDLAAAFFETVARAASSRMRSTTTTAMTGALSNRKPLNRAGIARVTEEARRIAERVKDGLVDAETRLRHDAADKMAQQQVRTVLDRMQVQCESLFHSLTDNEASEAAAQVLARELNPYLVRSSLAERCIRRPQGVVGTAEVLSHVLVNTAGGDGQLGEILDRWLLDRPTLQGLRGVRAPLVSLVAESVPQHRNRRVLLVNAGTGSLVAQLVTALRSHPTVLTVVDQSRDALAFLDAGLSDPAVELRPIQEKFVQFALGRSRHVFPPQDAIAIHGMLEYMPDRIAVSMLNVCRELLSPEGIITATALAPSDDQPVMDRVLDWPTIRRSAEHLDRLIQGAGLEVLPSGPTTGAGRLASARLARAPSAAPAPLA